MPIVNTMHEPSWSDWINYKEGKNESDDMSAYGEKLGKIQQVTVTSAGATTPWLNSITVYYEGGMVSKHPSTATGSVVQDFFLGEDEFIEKISYGLNGGYVCKLQFETTNGRKSAVLGNTENKSIKLTELPILVQNSVFGAFRYLDDGTGLIGLGFLLVADAIVSTELIDVNIVSSSTPVSTYPGATMPMTFINKSGNDQSSILVYRHAESLSINVSTGHSATVGAKLTLGWEVLAKLELELWASYTVSFVNGETTTTRREHEIRFTTIVPKKSQIKSQVVVARKEYQTTFTGKLKITYVNGSTETIDVPDGSMQGVHEGFQATITYDAATPITDAQTA